MDEMMPTPGADGAIRTHRSRRLKRHAATFAARCAMASWLVLAAMPLVVVVYSLA